MHTEPHSVLHSLLFLLLSSLGNRASTSSRVPDQHKQKDDPELLRMLLFGATKRREFFSRALNLCANICFSMLCLARSRRCFTCLEIISLELNVFSMKCKVNTTQSSLLLKRTVHLQLVNTNIHSFGSILVIF